MGRNSLQNALCICKGCHGLVDQPGKYSARELFDIKAQAEKLQPREEAGFEPGLHITDLYSDGDTQTNNFEHGFSAHIEKMRSVRGTQVNNFTVKSSERHS